MLSNIIDYLFIFHLVIEVPSNIDVKWKPNEENIFEFSYLISAMSAEDNDYMHLSSDPNISNGLKLKAQVTVQSFSDQTLRAKMNHIRFYTSAGPVTLETAHESLGDAEVFLFRTLNHGIKEFKNYLEEPMMISMKRGLMKNMIVSKDEPTCVTAIKESLFAELQTLNSTFGLKYLKKQPILSVLPIPSRPKKINAQI